MAEGARSIEVGEAAPAFRLEDQNGLTHTLKEHTGRWVALYFYPKDDTPGCTKEACSFRDAEAALKKAGVVVLGVSADDVKSHGKFARKFGLNFPLLADVGNRVCEAYGLWREKSMYGRTFMGIVRTTYLIDPRGKVAHRWDKVKVEEHAGEVLAVLEQLSKK